MDVSTIYKSVESIRERDIIWTPSLGYVPIIVKERRVLAEKTVEKIAEYTGGLCLMRSIL